MNTYITLMKLTYQGVKDLKEAPKRIAASIKAMEKTVGKLIGFVKQQKLNFILVG